MTTRNKKGTSPLPKKTQTTLSYITAEYTGPKTLLTMTDVAVHYVATYTNSNTDVHVYVQAGLRNQNSHAAYKNKKRKEEKNPLLV